MYRTKEFLENKKIKWAERANYTDKYSEFIAKHQMPDNLVKFEGKPVTTLTELRRDRPELFKRQPDGTIPLEKMTFKEFEKNIDYGYAISAHKSQGSTYHTVFADLDNIKNPGNLKNIHDSNLKVVGVERNNITYVALSRTSHDVVAYSRTAEDDLDIAKLSSVRSQANPVTNRPAVDANEPSSGAEQSLTISYLEERHKFLSGKMRRIGKDKGLSQAQKDDAIKQVKADQERIQSYIKNLQDNPEIIEFDRVASEDLDRIKSSLENPELSIDDVLEYVQGVKFYQILYRQLTSTDQGYGANLDFQLRDVTERHSAKAKYLMDKLLEIAKTQFVGQYNEDTGKTYTAEEMLKSQDNSAFENYLINALENKNTFVRMMGKTLGNMYKQSAAAIQEHQVQDNKRLDRFLKKYTFNTITKTEKYEDEFGIERTEKNFLSRNSITYFNKWKSLFVDAANKSLFPDTQAGKKAKSEYIANQIDEISHAIDIRRLYYEMHNEEHPSDPFTEDDSKEYYDDLVKFYTEQFAAQGRDYAIKRLDEVLKQADDKLQEYLLQKEAFEVVLDAENDPTTREDKMKDWLAHNSPFTLLNEQIGFRDASGKQVKHQTAKTSKVVQINTPSGPRDEHAFVDWSQRGAARDAIVRKANNLYHDHSPTGFYEENFLNMEAEHFRKQEQLDDMRSRGEDTTELEQNESEWEFLQWAIDTQKYYMAKFPGYLRNELRYNSLIDVTKDNEEIFDAAVQEIGLFNTLRLIPLGLNKVHDSLVNVVTERHFQEREGRLDYITEQIKKYYNPTNLNNKLNKEGRGDRKTEDAKKYFEILRNTALEYETKSEFESFIKLGEFLMNSAVFTPEGSKTGIKGELGDPANLVRWTVNNKLYGAKREKEATPRFTTRAKWLLTKKERDEVTDLEVRIGELNAVLDTQSLTRDQRRRVTLERDQAVDRISRIQRVVNNSTLAKTSLAAFRFHFMAWGTIGRAVDYLNSGIIGNAYEAADGRIFGFKDFAYAMTYVHAVYGASTLGGNLIVGAGVTLASGGAALPVLAAGAALRASGALANKVLMQKQQAKISQLLWRFGALENFHNLSDGNVTGFAMKNNVAKGTKSTLKLLLPYTPMEETEVVNKGISTMSALHAIQVEDLAGNKHPLTDAFIINDDMDLVWDEANYGPQEDAGYDWSDGKNMHKAKGLVDAALRNANGDYGSHATIGADKESRGKILIFLRRFLAQSIKRRVGDVGTGFGNRWTDEESGLSYVPRYNALFKGIGERRNGGTWDGNVNDDTRSAGKQFSMEIAVWISLGIVVHLLAGAFDKDQAYKKLYAFTILMENILGKSYAEQTQLVNPSVVKSRSMHGLHPYVSVMMDMANVGSAIWDSFGKGDIMSRQEMISNGLLVPNPNTKRHYIRRHKDAHGKWIDGKWETEYKSVGIYKEKGNAMWTTDAHYPARYSPQSRIGFRVGNLVMPGSTRSTKRAITTDLKIK